MWLAWQLQKLLVIKYQKRQSIDPIGKAILITGCDTGIGSRLALKLDRIGFHVYAGCLQPNSDDANRLKELGSSNITILKMDVTKSEDIDAAYDFVFKDKIEKKISKKLVYKL